MESDHSDSKVVKVPTVPNNELNVDYLTEGSVGSIDKESSIKRLKDNSKIKFESPQKIISKTTILREKFSVAPN